MSRVFISYARNDKKVAIELYSALEKQGISSWLDVKNLLPGQDWKAEIEKAIRGSVVFIACLSSNSVNKTGFVQAELKKALEVAETIPEGEIYIIPVRLEECNVPASLSRLQWVDYFEEEDKDKLSKAIELRLKKATLSSTLHTNQGVQFPSLVIAYSHRDGEFVDKLEEHLKENNLRFWRDIHDMRAGAVHKQYRKAIRENQVVLIILSENSAIDDWVEYMVFQGLVVQKETRRDVLLPIAIDNKWSSSLPKDIAEQITKYYILDFSGWQEDDENQSYRRFDRMLRKIISRLEFIYK
jgi:hypothetical protein